MLIISALFTVIGLSVLGTAGYLFTKKMADESSFFIEYQTAFFEIIQIEINAQKLMNKLSVHISAEEPSHMDEISHEIIELTKLVSDDLYKFYTSLLSIDERYDQHQKKAISLELENFQEQWSQFRLIIKKILHLSSDYSKADAYSLISTDGKKIFNKAISIIDLRIQNYRNKTELFRDQVRQYQEYTVRGILFISIIGIGLGVAINVWIIFNIMNLLNTAVTISEKVASGDTKVDIKVVKKDEMGKLLIAQKEMINSIQSVIEQANMISKGDYSINIVPRSKNDYLSLALNEMTQTLKEVTIINKEQDWIKTGQAELNDRMRGNKDAYDLANSIVTYIANYINAQVGAIYMNNTKNVLRIVGSYAFKTHNSSDYTFQLGEGLIGQAAVEMKSILIKGIPFDQTNLIIHTGLNESVPSHIYIVPFVYEGILMGVMEFGKMMDFSEAEQTLLDMVSENIAIAFNSSDERYRARKLLEETKRQAEELKSQKEELAEKSMALSLSNQYKSNFLANMSHELRSPLNSILLLSQSLSENKDGILSEDLVQHAKTIHISGRELLDLINDILDMAKVESGKEELTITEYKLEDLPLYVRMNFEKMAEQKGLILKTEIGENLPLVIKTDQRRLEQIVRNFMSNALKFTVKGTIIFKIYRPISISEFEKVPLSPNNTIIISVSDTGIGIAKEKQQIIFEAFQQANGSTCRKYGGTGLGLSISKKIASLLKGEITLHSKVGQGSTFSLYLPEIIETEVIKEFKNDEEECSHLINDDIDQSDHNIKTSEKLEMFLKDKVILLIDDDMRNVYALSHYFTKRGIIVEQAFDGKEAMQILEKNSNLDLILIDTMIPEMDCYELMKKIREKTNYQDIPMIALSANHIKEDRDKSIKSGASDYISKPVDTLKLFSLMRRWLS